ncbi:MAG: ferritin-like domain-containing protein [Polyangiaceae bacterium]|nr:ferritin-like domain-containing protein [Polyangiaceae bacterium]
MTEPSPPRLDLEALGIDRGGDLLVRRALRGIAPGTDLRIAGSHPDLLIHLRVLCRAAGHEVRVKDDEIVVRRGTAVDAPRRGAVRAGKADPRSADAVVDAPSPRWGLAARGALVEAGAPAFHRPLSSKDEIWADDAAHLYAQAAANQWDPATAIPWAMPFELPDEVEDAVVQIMTYLIENETAALLVPARFVAQIHPHFREVMQLLAIQAADEARHIEVFTRRALLRRKELGLSTAGGQASLQTLVDEPDFALASFLLSVLGEGTFLSLLWFLHEHAPDPVTRDVVRLAAQDEARHVSFGLAHLGRHLSVEPSLFGRLALAVERRHDTLRNTAGLNQEVWDGLVLLAAGSFRPSDIARGHDAVLALSQEMEDKRARRLERLGFEGAQARALSQLHTKNFM